MSWNAAVDFRKGKSHVKREEPCQDYGQITKLKDDIIVGAVADGAGSAKYSHIGAKTAVRSAINTMRSNTSQFEAIARHPNFNDAAEVLQALLGNVQESLESTAADHLAPLNDLATTLIVIVASPNGMAAMQIGDGFIVFRQSGRRYELMFRPDKGEHINETSFITESDATASMQVAVHDGPLEFFCASTDALEPLSIRYSDWKPHTPFFRPLDECTALAKDDDDVHRGIRAFLRSDGLVERVEDDCTLMLGGYHSETRFSGSVSRV
jgi:serine/threonine protein phosphatase PrpC